MADLNIRVQFDAALHATEAQIRAHIAATAILEHQKVISADPRPGGFRRWVDGKVNVPEKDVKRNGIIVYVYHRLDDVVRYAMDTLFARSPVDSGDYRMLHAIFIDGTGVTNLKDWKSGQEVVILNPLPYSRKIEQGRMIMRVSGTDHVYEQATRAVNRRYGNIASVRFSYRAVIGHHLPSRHPTTKGGRQLEREARVPAMVIRERGER